MSLAILNNTNNNSNNNNKAATKSNGAKQVVVDGGDNTTSSVHITTAATTAAAGTTSTISSTIACMTTTQETGAIDAHRRQIIKRKVLAIGKMSRSYAVLKEYPDLVQQLKSLSANGKIPLGSLSNGEQGIREAIATLLKQKQQEEEQQDMLIPTLKMKEEKEHFTYHHQPTPNYKVVSREGHV